MMKLITVFELGSSKTAGIIAQADDRGETVILAAAEVPSNGIRKGAVVDLIDVQNAIKEVWRQLEPFSGDSRSVVVVMGGSTVSSNSVRGFRPIVPKTRPITADDVLQVVNHSRKQVLPPDFDEIQAIPQTFSIDGQNGISKPIGLSGSKLEVSTMLVSASRSQLQNIDRAFETSGLKVDGYMLCPYASGLAVLSKSQMEIGSGVVDLGSGSTELAIFHRGSLASRASIPLGSSNITSDIFKLLKTSPDEGERLKLEFGCAMASDVPPDETIGVTQLGQIHERPMQARVLCEIVESRAKEIAQFVGQQLEKSGFSGLLPGGIALVGGGARLPSIEKLFAATIEGNNFSVPKVKLGRGSVSVNPLTYASLIGAAKYGLAAVEELSTIEPEIGLVGKVKTIWSMMSGKELT